VSLFAGTFVDARGRGEHVTGLAGRGTIRLESSRLHFTGQRPQAQRAAVVAGLLASFLLLASVTLFILSRFSRRLAFLDLEFAVVIFAAVLVGSFIGLRALLVKVLPLQSVEVAVEHPFVVFARINGAHLEILTTSPDLAGLSVLEMREGVRFVEELEIARRGANGGYRSTR